jgi:hypothetical protein
LLLDILVLWFFAFASLLAWDSKPAVTCLETIPVLSDYLSCYLLLSFLLSCSFQLSLSPFLSISVLLIGCTYFISFLSVSLLPFLVYLSFECVCLSLSRSICCWSLNTETTVMNPNESTVYQLCTFSPINNLCQFLSLLLVGPGFHFSFISGLIRHPSNTTF